MCVFKVQRALLRITKHYDVAHMIVLRRNKVVDSVHYAPRTTILIGQNLETKIIGKCWFDIWSPKYTLVETLIKITSEES